MSIGLTALIDDVVGLAKLAAASLDDAWRLGQDTALGGVFESGPAGAVADMSTRTDWDQAEALLTLAEWFRCAREPRHQAAFLRTLDWIGRWQVDWANGSWHGLIDPSGQPVGKKADSWNSTYHTGRAVLGCLRVLDGIATGIGKGGCTPI